MGGFEFVCTCLNDHSYLPPGLLCSYTTPPHWLTVEVLLAYYRPTTWKRSVLQQMQTDTLFSWKSKGLSKKKKSWCFIQASLIHVLVLQEILPVFSPFLPITLLSSRVVCFILFSVSVVFLMMPFFSIHIRYLRIRGVVYGTVCKFEPLRKMCDFWLYV